MVGVTTIDGVVSVVFDNGDDTDGTCEPVVIVIRITVVEVDVVVELDAVVESIADGVVERVEEAVEILAVELDAPADELVDELVEELAADFVEEIVVGDETLVEAVVDPLAGSVVNGLAEEGADGNADIGVIKVEVAVNVCTTG